MTCVITDFENPPRPAPIAAIFDLPFHRGLISLVKKRVFISWHHQERHQVFEHGPAPGDEDWISSGTREQTSQSKPVFLRHSSLGDCHETGESGFGSEQVVIT